MPLITGKTQLLGVIGYPVSHSLSPIMQNAALQAMGLDICYVAFPIVPRDLPQAIAGLWSSGIQGLNITIPHKQTVMDELIHLTAIAQQVGAVNTLWRGDTGWQGTNTDVFGFMAPLRHQNRDWSTIIPVVLGNGGAARAVVAGCEQLGCPEAVVVGRSSEKLAQFQRQWEQGAHKILVNIQQWDTSLTSVLSQTQLLVNTTPIGMGHQADYSPIAQDSIRQLPPTAIVYDLIYTPRPTLLLKQAQAHGLVTIDGTEMLIQQGAAALHQWVKKEIPIPIMRDVLLDFLSRNGR